MNGTKVACKDEVSACHAIYNHVMVRPYPVYILSLVALSGVPVAVYSCCLSLLG